MLCLKKASKKTILIGISFLNIIILGSLLIDILIQKGYLSDFFIIFAIPAKILTANVFFFVVITIIECLGIFYYWIQERKRKQTFQTSNETEDFNFLSDNDEADNIEDFGILPIDYSNLSSTLENDSLDHNNSIIDFSKYVTNSDKNYSKVALENPPYVPEDEDSESEFSPGFLATYKDSQTNPFFEQAVNVQRLDQTINSESNNIVSDYEFAIYQNIVTNNWLYEKGIDRIRIGFDHNSIDESSISLSDITKLTKLGMIFKQKIHHPSGSFFVFSSDSNVEKRIILDCIRQIFRKEKLKLVSRKIDFVYWQEIGIARRLWQFDFESLNPQIIGCVWTDDSFSIIDGALSILYERKEELKALIASSTLKMNDGYALIITNKKEHLDLINRFLKNTGWGQVLLFNFSDSKFYEKFRSCLLDKRD